MEFKYRTRGTCSSEMYLEIEDNILKDLRIMGGCHGNLQGITALVTGMNIDDVIAKLKGIRCGMKDTSCPDQLATALELAKKKMAE